MKLVVDAFKNVTQKETVVFPTHWNCIISLRRFVLFDEFPPRMGWRRNICAGSITGDLD
jgi:hypothetical protein